jgi:DNA-binding response OmpR family regulator
MLANETNKQILIVDRDVASVEPLRHKLTDTRLLRGTEYRLLEFLMTHPGRTFNRTQLPARVWGGFSSPRQTAT